MANNKLIITNYNLIAKNFKLKSDKLCHQKFVSHESFLNLVKKNLISNFETIFDFLTKLLTQINSKFKI